MINYDLSKVKIIDNYIDDLELTTIDFESNHWNYNLTNAANRHLYFPSNRSGTHRFWYSSLFDRKDDYNVLNNAPKNILSLYEHICHFLLKKKYILHQIQVNGQGAFQNGTIHQDSQYGDNHYTLMVFINSKWDQKWGGEFQLFDGMDSDAKLLKSIEFVPGRIIYFDGGIPHKGKAPVNTNIVRKTLVFRIEKIN